MVVRLVANRDGESGGAAAAAFRDGLRHAAVCLYVGHWRYGLGADFGRALPVEVRGAPELPSDLRGLARAAKAESRRRGEPLEAVLDRWSRDGRIAVDGRDEPARVVFGDANLAPGSPTAQVVHWAARAAGNRTPADVSGLATTTAPAHRLWMLISCRTASSFPSLRRALDGSALRLVGLRGMSVLGNWRSLPWVLDALRAGGTWREVTGAIDQGLNPGGVVVDGWEHDPVIP
ncbi:MAG TPA: hypothetical protein VNT03_13450 [Baekduia sp.]|nr:hypothetical protein [Baekduia sp.]